MKWNGTRLTAGCRCEQGGISTKRIIVLILALALVLGMLCAAAEDSDAGLMLGEWAQTTDEGITIEDEAADEGGMDIELADDILILDINDKIGLDVLNDNLELPVDTMEFGEDIMGGSAYTVNAENYGEPSADSRIFIFDQGYSGENNVGGNISIIHNGVQKTMSSAGCSLYTYLHAYQWLTGDKKTGSNAVDLIYQFLNISKNVKDDDAYAKFFLNYGIIKSTPNMNENSLLSHFRKGGVVKVYTPNGGRHFVLAVGGINADLDNNGVSETWIHIIDSAAYFTFNPTQGTVTDGCRSFSSHSVINKSILDSRNSSGASATNRRSEDNYAALEYWMNYNIFKDCGIVVGYVPGDGGSQPITASTLQFTNVTYPKTFRINTSAGWALGGGMVESNYDLKTLKTEILNSSGNAISSATVSISGKSYAIRNLDTYSTSDNGVKFSYIKTPGSYKWVLTVTDSKGRSLTLEMPITAVSSGSTITATANKKWEQSDTTAPAISNVQISNISSDGYKVSCNVSDNVGVVSVKFPTWTEQNGQDDIIWHEGTLSGSTASYNVKVSDHKNEQGCKYITHIYAYDVAGNNASYGITVNVPAPDTSAPTISNIEVSNVNSKGYTITCTVSDNVDVTSVKFPTWTEPSGQDDIIWHEGTLSGSKASFTLSVSDHNNENGCQYITHIYAYDAAGNNTSKGVNVNVPAADTIAPTISDVDATDVNSEGYTMSCTVTDNVGVTKVQFLVCTGDEPWENGIWHDAMISGNTASCRINVSEHGNRRDVSYYTRTFAWDAAGNEAEYHAALCIGISSEDVAPEATATPKVKISNCMINVNNQVYTGKALNPAVTVRYGGTTLQRDIDYAVSYKNNKAIGMATVTVTGKGDFTGTAKTTFKINPKAVSGLRLTAGKGKLTFKWNKGSNITGYQLQYGLKKNFSGAKKVDISKASIVKGTIKNLKKGKSYYVRIRAFKKVGKTTYWSAWSEAKKAKVK